MQGRDNPMKSPLRLRDPVLAAALAAVAMTGCHSTMTSAHDPSPAGSDAVPPNRVPPTGHGPTSAERRVGQVCPRPWRSRWPQDHYNKTKLNCIMIAKMVLQQ